MGSQHRSAARQQAQRLRMQVQEVDSPGFESSLQPPSRVVLGRALNFCQPLSMHARMGVTVPAEGQLGRGQVRRGVWRP